MLGTQMLSVRHQTDLAQNLVSIRPEIANLRALHRTASIRRSPHARRAEAKPAFGFELGTLIGVARLCRQSQALVGFAEIPVDQRHRAPIRPSPEAR